MAHVNTRHKGNPEAFNEEKTWDEGDNKRAKLIKNMGKYSLYHIDNEDLRYYLIDTDNKYIASVEYHKETSLNHSIGISIMYGYSKVRGAYKVLLDSILQYTNNQWVMSDRILSVPASKFWLKYIDEIQNTKYNLFLYNTQLEKVLPFDKHKAISYDDDKSSRFIRIGVSTTKLTENNNG